MHFFAPSTPHTQKFFMQDIFVILSHAPSQKPKDSPNHIMTMYTETKISAYSPHHTVGTVCA
ncbi:MAG: hypothetical protein CL920_00110 [Deltaproteobacteria bacterium]|nr:hypothetical protein [Deltaproteobacteria bacterium]|tara:strand:+ start:19727 stop:19912 length:186 start_codon:yes stop_codon:yes gene_type:complete